MVTLCDKCRRRHLVDYQVDPKEAWHLVVQNRWRNLCPSCFDAAAELLKIRYQFVNMHAASWSGAPGSAKRPKKQR